MKRLLSLVIVLTLTLTVLPQQQAYADTFSDVPTSHTYYHEIMFLLEKGVISGGGRYGVDDKVTREEVAVMVSKAVGLDGKQSETKFKDVPKSRATSGYINSAVEAGIINGYPDSTFKPDALVTRGHMAAFIARGFKLDVEANISFSDVPKGSTAYEPVRKLAHKNITTGYTDGTFKPDENLSRAHISVFLARAMLMQDMSEDIKTPILTEEEIVLKYLFDTGEYQGSRNDLFIFPISKLDRIIEVSFLNSKDNPYLNRWLFKNGQLVDKLWYGSTFNENYTSNSLIGGILLPIKNPNVNIEPIPTPAPVPNIKIYPELYGHDGTFLGILTTNRYSIDSVFNEYGSYGSKYSSTSIWNSYSIYGSEYALNSAFNKYSTNAPRIIFNGKVIGYVTANPYTYQGIHPNYLYNELLLGGF